MLTLRYDWAKWSSKSWVVGRKRGVVSSKKEIPKCIQIIK
jgi:hypothetical protein